jgi:hypothetical protein
MAPYLGCSSNHILDIVSVARAIYVGVVALVGLVPEAKRVSHVLANTRNGTTALIAPIHLVY